MALLLDMDGVLLQGSSTPRDTYHRATDHVLDQLNVDLTDQDRTDLRVYSYEKLVDACRSVDLPISPSDFWQRREQAVSKLENTAIEAGERKLYEDTAVLPSLAAEMPLAIVSNNRQATVEFVAEYFDLPVAIARGRDPTPQGFRRRKPDPYYLLEVFDQLDARFGVYVGDREKDMIAADRAGLEGVFMRRSHNQAQSCPDIADFEISSLQELPELVAKARQ